MYWQCQKQNLNAQNLNDNTNDHLFNGGDYNTCLLC